MKLILFCMNAEASPHFASFKLAKQLVAANFKVLYVGFRFFETMVLMHDLEYLSIDHNEFVEEDGSFVATNRQLNQMFCDFMENWLKDNSPDLAIIGNIRLLEYSTPFHKRNIPVVGFGSNLSTSFSLKYPPITSSRQTNSSIPWIATAENLFDWIKLYANNWPTHLSKLFKLILYKRRYGWQFEYGEYGYKIKVPNIVTMPAEFHLPCVRLREMDCYIGAAVDEDRLDRRPLPIVLDPGKKLICCSLGTHKYVKEKYFVSFFKAVVKAVQAREHLQMILHVRKELHHLLPDTSANKNIVVLDWIPLMNVLSKSALFITHGGMGSVRESIFLGVPMIAFPLSVDQPGIVARLEHHHLGLSGNIFKVNEKTFGDMIDRVMSDPSYSAAAKRMQQRFKDQENIEGGIHFIRKIMADTISKS